MKQESIADKHPRARRLTLVLGAFLLSGCSIFEGADCLPIGTYGIHVVVEDSLSGGALSASPSLTVVDGSYTETQPQPNGAGGITFLAALERPGSYDVTVRATGYQDWTQSDVLVTRQPGRCDYLTSTRLTARMQLGS